MSIKWNYQEMEQIENGMSKKWNEQKIEWAKNGMSRKWKDQKKEWAKNGMSNKWNEQKMKGAINWMSRKGYNPDKLIFCEFSCAPYLGESIVKNYSVKLHIPKHFTR